MLVANQQRNFTEAIPDLGLVAEGGGQRGAFTAGVLDSWLVSNFNPFSVLIGTSAGAQNIASFLSKQTGYAYSLLVDLTRNSSFFNPWRMLIGNNALDLDWYFSHASNTTYQFDQKQADQPAQNRKVRFSASDSSQLKPQLIDPVEQGWLDSMRYSSAIPYLYKSKQLLDGGISAPIPVREAYELGAKSIITIRTTMNTDNVVPKGLKQLKPFVCRGKQCPNFFKIMDKHEDAYVKTERFIQSPPDDEKVYEIKPLRPLKSKVLGSSKQDIIDDYKHGFKLGKQFANAFKKARSA